VCHELVAQLDDVLDTPLVRRSTPSERILELGYPSRPAAFVTSCGGTCDDRGSPAADVFAVTDLGFGVELTKELDELGKRECSSTRGSCLDDGRRDVVAFEPQHEIGAGELGRCERGRQMTAEIDTVSGGGLDCLRKSRNRTKV